MQPDSSHTFFSSQLVYPSPVALAFTGSGDSTSNSGSTTSPSSRWTGRVSLGVNHIAAHYLLNDSLLKALNSINHKSYFCCVFSRMSAEDLFMKAAYFMETS